MSVRLGTAVENYVEILINAGKSPYYEAEVLSRNFRVKTGEIDFVLECNEWCSSGTVSPIKRRILVFLEVRHRANGGMVSPEESVTSTKRRKIERAARMFLTHYKGTATEIRFDVCAVDLDRVRWITEAWF